MVPSFLTCINPVEFEKFFPQKEHLKVLGDSVDSLPYFLRFSLSLAEHQNIIETDGSLDVTGDDSSLVPSLEDSHPDLNDFACNARAADYLCNLSGD